MQLGLLPLMAKQQLCSRKQTRLILVVDDSSKDTFCRIVELSCMYARSVSGNSHDFTQITFCNRSLGQITFMCQAEALGQQRMIVLCQDQSFEDFLDYVENEFGHRHWPIKVEPSGKTTLIDKDELFDSICDGRLCICPPLTLSSLAFSQFSNGSPCPLWCIILERRCALCPAGGGLLLCSLEISAPHVAI